MLRWHNSLQRERTSDQGLCEEMIHKDLEILSVDTAAEFRDYDNIPDCT